MARRCWTLGLLALVGGFATSAGAANDQQTLAKLYGKVAPPFSIGQKLAPKLACVCHETADFDQPGFVLTDPRGSVRCGVATNFNSDGSIAGLDFCDDFVALGH